MKKPPKRKPQQSKPSLQQLTTSTNHKTPTQSPTEALKAPPAEREAKLTFGSVWKDFWSYVGPLITILGLMNYYWPSISIASGVNLDPKQDFQTQFVVTNTGNVPVHGVSFACALVGHRVSIGKLVGGGNTLSPIATLTPGEPASRGCFTKSLSIDGPLLKVTTYYRWPLIGAIASKHAYFSAQRGTDGVFLVPEAAPSPEPPTLLRIGDKPEQ
ncbi:hypothetical protein LNAOJCKE_2971 [Methylorubrum aminovorans]|uniref:DUF4232 domain-containing protein n=1 Tax=Methylorubrum aminovorans TaxID=269069 RepID=A0ABQ4UEN5_9HYPH|nr:hypothetical protein [Methylorubrum aminovorans]GJE65758.1 hypothetical protein LNAOJCKE_2971 [Methylorubrum aminovorans]